MDVPRKRTRCATRILDAAGHLFARQGFHATSTREIARLAQTTENTLFRTFRCKEDIFWAVLSCWLADLAPPHAVRDGLETGEAPEAVLPKLLDQLADAVLLKPELVRLLGIALIEFRESGEEMCRNHLGPLLSTFADYLSANMAAQKLRKVNVPMLIAALLVTVIAYPALAQFVAGIPHNQASYRDICLDYTRFWLSSLSTHPHTGVHAARGGMA